MFGTCRYILTSDISQRTKCCLLSAHLFKVNWRLIWQPRLLSRAVYWYVYLWFPRLPQCVLCCSLAHPLDDLRYASYSIGDELLPGVGLFSEPHRADLAATVASLNFICQWLFIAGYHKTVDTTQTWRHYRNKSLNYAGVTHRGSSKRAILKHWKKGFAISASTHAGALSAFCGDSVSRCSTQCWKQDT